ncbi:competence pheromone ComX [Bacillus amyloliquefaciens]|uniref:competence pheromone ComX n=1 Tax=Bacillus amyloliquefaciens TaxID=1390 RepID=UPI0039F6CAA3
MKKQDIVNYLIENPRVIHQLEEGEVCLIGIPHTLIPAIIEIFSNSTYKKKPEFTFWDQ